MKTVLIDGDSIIYILAWTNRELEAGGVSADEADAIVCSSVDELIRGILQATQATHYMGAIGHAEGKCFRHTIARHKPYKGTRDKEPDAWVLRFKPLIRRHLEESWHFISHPDLEADDLVALAAESLAKVAEPFIVSSPDKDLRQIAGTHYDYKKMDFADVTPEQADRHFWMQMLTGDSSDNVAGVPGLGDKKAHDLLAKADQDGVFYEQVVRAAYLKYFDDFYGQMIYWETYNVLKLVTTNHAFFADDMCELSFHSAPGVAAANAFGL